MPAPSDLKVKLQGHTGPGTPASDRAAQTDGVGNLQTNTGIEPDWPDPKPLPTALPNVEGFDFDLLPESLRPWAADLCERVGCPPDYVAVAIMTALGAVIGRKGGIRPQAKTDWTVTANQWGLCIGRPGVLKSPALEAALAPLKRLVATANERYDADRKQFEQESKLRKIEADLAEKTVRKALEKKPDTDVSGLLAKLTGNGCEAPACRRYIANNSTVEALAEMHRQNPTGLLVFRDELVSLLKSLDREESSEARGFYLTGWNGDSPYTFDRILRGLNLHIPAVCLSLLGSTQPGKIAKYVQCAVRGGETDDGLLQRFGLTVWPDTNGPWKECDRWPDTKAKNEAFQVFQYLDEIDPTRIGAAIDKDVAGNVEGIPYLRFDRDALGLFREWRTDLEAKLRSDLHPALESHFAKYRKLAPSLALILHLAAGASGDVSEHATLQALAWTEYLESHARRLYSSASSSEIVTAAAILQKIRTGALASPFAARDIYRAGWTGLSDRQQVKEGLLLLVDLDWLRLQSRPTTGRTAAEYEINPKGFDR